MNRLRKIVHYPLLMLIPTIAAIWLFLMAIQGHGLFRLCRHICQNTLLIGRRILKLLGALTKEDVYVNPSFFSFVIILMGMPFVVVMILLDDIE